MASPSNGPVVFLLGPRTSHADFERFAQANGLIFHEERPSTGPKDAYEQIWVTQDRSTAIHYMDDPTPKERFLVVYGRGTGSVSFNVGASLDIQTADDVLDRALWVATDPERIHCAWQIGVVTKIYDESALDILKSLYDGASEDVRYAVINAVGYRGWPEAREFLERAASDDPSPALRENARAIIEAWWDDNNGAGEAYEGT